MNALLATSCTEAASYHQLFENIDMDYSQASCITSSSQEEINTVSAQQSKEREASGLLLSHMLGLNIDILKLHTVALIETTIVRVINNLKKVHIIAFYRHLMASYGLLQAETDN